MRFPFVKSAKAISSQRLQNAHINISVKVAQKFFAIDLRKIPQPVDIKIKQLLPQIRRQVRLGIVEQGSNVILKRALAPALVIQEKRFPTSQHDIARLEIPIHEIVAIGAQQKVCQAVEVVFQSLLAKRNPGQPEKVILEIIQIPRNRLPVE